MPAVTVRNIPEKTHRALKQRAAKNGRSTEAEIRPILEESASQKPKLKIDSELAVVTAVLSSTSPVTKGRPSRRPSLDRP